MACADGSSFACGPCLARMTYDAPGVTKQLKFDDKGDLTEPAFVMYSWNDGKYQLATGK